MMREHSRQEEMWSEPVNLAKRIPEDHLLRKINRVLKLDFVREEVAGFYGRQGNESVDPVIIMKLMLLLFLDDVASERELMRIVPLRIDYLWFLGYGLDDEIPNHSVLSKARARWGGEVFETLFSKTVEQCIEAGLVGAEKLHVDASLVKANASRNSVIRVEVKKQIKKLEPEDQDDESGKGSVNQELCSKTDPEARLARAEGRSIPSYKVHRGIDDKAGVITAIETSAGSINEAHKLMDLVEQHESFTGCKPQVVVADSKYGTTENFIALAKENIRSHMADLRSKMVNVRQEGIYPAKRFKYDPKTDRYRCPAGRKLHRHHYHHQRGYYEYRTQEGVCNQCRLKSLCTRASYGRTLKRYPEQTCLDRARRQSHGRQAKLDRKRRQHFQERNFAEAAVHHGMKTARWRRLWRQSIQDLLIAAIQNLKILVRNLIQKGKGSEKLLMPLLSTLDQLKTTLRQFNPLYCS